MVRIIAPAVFLRGIVYPLRVSTRGQPHPVRMHRRRDCRVRRVVPHRGHGCSEPAAAAACRAAIGWSGLRAAAHRSAGRARAAEPGDLRRESTDLSQVAVHRADIKFMQGMIGHHAQALEMVELLKTRTSSDDMKKLALRIELSQARRDQDDAALARGARPARARAARVHQHGAQMMPGMLTPDEMEQLAAAKGAEFDRLFLEGMIKHHGGALTMVKELLATPGAAPGVGRLRVRVRRRRRSADGDRSDGRACSQGASKK